MNTDAPLRLPWGSPGHSKAVGSGLMAMLGPALTMVALYPPAFNSPLHHFCHRSCATGFWCDKTLWGKGIAQLQGKGSRESPLGR